MGNEAPLIQKALKIVSFALILTTIALAASVGYSGFREYQALRGLESNSNQIQFGLSGNNLTLSGINIPNNMTYPIDLHITGVAALEGSLIGKFDSGSKILQPGQVEPLNVNFGLNFSQAFRETNVFKQALLNGSTLQVNASIDASVYPIVGLNITQTINQTMPAVLGNLKASINPSQVTLSSDGRSLLMPVQLSWTNGSPLQLIGNMNLNLTSIPGKPLGNYGTGGGPFAITPGPDQDNITLKIPLSDFSGSNLTRGTYTMDISIDAFGNSITVPESVTI